MAFVRLSGLIVSMTCGMAVAAPPVELNRRGTAPQENFQRQSYSDINTARVLRFVNRRSKKSKGRLVAERWNNEALTVFRRGDSLGVS